MNGNNIMKISKSTIIILLLSISNAFASDPDLQDDQLAKRFSSTLESYYAARASDKEALKVVRQNFETLLSDCKPRSEVRGKTLYMLARMKYDDAKESDNPFFWHAYLHFTEASETDLKPVNRLKVLYSLALMEYNEEGKRGVQIRDIREKLTEVLTHPDVDSDTQFRAQDLWHKLFIKQQALKKQGFIDMRQNLTVIMNSRGSEITSEQLTRIKIKLAIMDWKGQGILSSDPENAHKELNKLYQSDDTPIALKPEICYYMAKIDCSQNNYEFAYLALRGAKTCAEICEAQRRNTGFSEAFIYLGKLDLVDTLCTQTHNVSKSTLLQCKILYLQGIMNCKGLGTPIDYKEARLKFETVVKLAPENSSIWAQAHYGLAKMNFRGQGTGSMIDVFELDEPNFVKAREHLALARPGLKKCNQLRVDFSLALIDYFNDKPDYDKAYEGFQKIAEQSIDPELASEAEKYLQEINSRKAN